jgi:ADP-ribosylglycohydrolase
MSHTKNGLYGAAFCAALISAAVVCTNMREAIDTALKYVPSKSRLYLALTDFLKYYETCRDSSRLIEYVHERFDEKDSHDWCHVIPNDLLICAALLCGGDDFEKVVGIAVEAGFDTDCNAATAGSAFGMMYGTKSIPESWVKPLNGKIFSRVGMTGQAKFEELAQRCLKLADKYIL